MSSFADRLAPYIIKHKFQEAQKTAEINATIRAKLVFKATFMNIATQLEKEIDSILLKIATSGHAIIQGADAESKPSLPGKLKNFQECDHEIICKILFLHLLDFDIRTKMQDDKLDFGEIMIQMKNSTAPDDGWKLFNPSTLFASEVIQIAKEAFTFMQMHIQFVPPVNPPVAKK